MDLVIIYGPPGVGKLTVAQALAAITGFRVFHNHIAMDCAEAVLPRGTPEFSELVIQLRLAVLDAASAAEVSLIITYLYGYPQDTEKVERLAHAVERRGGRVCFV